jgi:hypothetical protein
MDECAVVPRVDRLLVWNEAMKAEAVAKHGYEPSRVSVIGLLRCDDFGRLGGRIEREAFLAERGFAPDRKLITIVVNSRGRPDVFVRAATALLDADREKTLGPPIQVLVRLAPRSNPADFAVLEAHPHARLDSSFDFGADVPVADADVAKTAALLRHTDILISVVSTLILESACFATPNIALRFPEFREFYERDFLSPLFETGGVRVVEDVPSLLDAVRLYLVRPERDAEGRAAIRQRLCYGADGLAKTRALREIARILGS